jgi:pimeloyl-ACP methyl ester carboxylesterase
MVGQRNGPNEFYITGSLKTWSVIDELHKIQVPTLLINGEFDEAQDSVMEPFFNRVDKVKWVTIPGGSHTTHLEDTERFIRIVGEFLT